MVCAAECPPGAPKHMAAVEVGGCQSRCRCRQDAAGQGHRGRGRRALLLLRRLRVRGGLRGRGRLPRQGPLREGGLRLAAAAQPCPHTSWVLWLDRPCARLVDGCCPCTACQKASWLPAALELCAASIRVPAGPAADHDLAASHPFCSCLSWALQQADACPLPCRPSRRRPASCSSMRSTRSAGSVVPAWAAATTSASRCAPPQPAPAAPLRHAQHLAPCRRRPAAGAGHQAGRLCAPGAQARTCAACAGMASAGRAAADDCVCAPLQTINQLLSEMDGFEGNTGVIVVAATNRPDVSAPATAAQCPAPMVTDVPVIHVWRSAACVHAARQQPRCLSRWRTGCLQQHQVLGTEGSLLVQVLDAALLRPGRFDRQVTVDRPDVQGRVKVLKVHSRGKSIGKDVDFDKVARRTPGGATPAVGSCLPCRAGALAPSLWTCGWRCAPRCAPRRRRVRTWKPQAPAWPADAGGPRTHG